MIRQSQLNKTVLALKLSPKICICAAGLRVVNCLFAAARWSKALSTFIFPVGLLISLALSHQAGHSHQSQVQASSLRPRISLWRGGSWEKGLTNDLNSLGAEQKLTERLHRAPSKSRWPKSGGSAFGWTMGCGRGRTSQAAQIAMLSEQPRYSVGCWRCTGAVSHSLFLP